MQVNYFFHFTLISYYKNIDDQLELVKLLTPISQRVFQGHGSETSVHTLVSMYYMAQLWIGGDDKDV